MRKIGLLVSLVLFIFMAPGVNAESPKIGPSEISFAQGMIPHHKQAVAMANLALKYSHNKSVLAIARSIKAEQAPEINQMRSWLVNAHVKSISASPMSAMAMGTNGMLSPTQLAALGAARDGAFDRLFLLSMIGHHKGAIQMSQQLGDSKYPEAIILHQNIIKVQTFEIAQMKKLLATL